MENNDQKNKQTINSNTQIIFTIKSFFGLISTILILFVGFYTLVIVPSLNKSEKYQEKIYGEQKEYISTEFNDIKQSIQSNTQAIRLNTRAINSTNERFKDLNKSFKEIANSSGSFGYNPNNDSNSLVENSN